MRRLILLILCALLLLTIATTAGAQTNLLVNPGMEGDYAGGYMRAVPGGWSPWVAEGNPDFYPEVYGSVFSGGRSQALLTSSQTFTAGIYQVVNGIAPGSVVQASAWAHLSVTYSDNLAGTYSHMRVGIDPNGGTNPYDGDVVWSGELTSTGPTTIIAGRLWTEYTQLSVNATVTGSAVTIFLWGSQNWAAVEHRQYWDNASLNLLSGEAAAPSAPAPAAPTGRQLESWVGLNVRSGPGLENGRIGVIYPGMTYAIVSEHPDWYGIDYNGVTGYVYGGFVNVTGGSPAPVTDASTPTTTSPPTGLNFRSPVELSLRAGPTRSAAKLGVFPIGTVAQVIGRDDSNSWLQVQFDGQTGWVAWWLGTLTGGNYWNIPITG
jgi:uncharacterized protein YraI